MSEFYQNFRFLPVVTTVNARPVKSQLIPSVSLNRKQTNVTCDEDRIIALALRIAEMTGGIPCDGDALSSNPDPFTGSHSFIDTVAWLQRISEDYHLESKLLGEIITTAQQFLMSYGVSSEVALSSVATDGLIRQKLQEWANSLMVVHKEHRQNREESETKSTDPSELLLSRLLSVATESANMLQPEPTPVQKSSPALELPDYLTCLLFAEVRDKKSLQDDQRTSSSRIGHASTHLLKDHSHSSKKKRRNHALQHCNIGFEETSFQLSQAELGSLTRGSRESFSSETIPPKQEHIAFQNSTIKSGKILGTVRVRQAA